MDPVGFFLKVKLNVITEPKQTASEFYSQIMIGLFDDRCAGQCPNNIRQHLNGGQRFGRHRDGRDPMVPIFRLR